MSNRCRIDKDVSIGLLVCQLGCDVINFEISLNLLIKPFFLQDQNLKTKT